MYDKLRTLDISINFNNSILKLKNRKSIQNFRGIWHMLSSIQQQFKECGNETIDLSNFEVFMFDLFI